MFSILDILRKHREEKNRGAAPVESGMSVTKAGSAAVPAPSVKSPDAVSVYSALDKGIAEENMRQMAQVYDEAVAAARKVYAPGGPDTVLLSGGLDPVISGITAALSRNHGESFQFFFAEYPDARDYLCYHAVNVCLFAVEFGLELRYDPAVIADLAKAAFLHDVGMAPMAAVFMKPSQLTAGEIGEIRSHPQKGLEAVTAAGVSSQGVQETVMQEHERYDGSGYPKGLKADGISEFAQVVGLVDVYEALIHARPYRPRYSPAAAVNVILNAKHLFSPRMIKLLIKRVGIFPAGTRVRLNTKETGVVIKANPFSPLRPVVNVIADANGNVLKVPREIDLCKNYLIHIEENLGK